MHGPLVHSSTSVQFSPLNPGTQQHFSATHCCRGPHFSAEQDSRCCSSGWQDPSTQRDFRVQCTTTGYLQGSGAFVQFPCLRRVEKCELDTKPSKHTQSPLIQSPWTPQPARRLPQDAPTTLWAPLQRMSGGSCSAQTIAMARRAPHSSIAAGAGRPPRPAAGAAAAPAAIFDI